MIDDLWLDITDSSKTVSSQGEEVCITNTLQDLNAKFKWVQETIQNARVQETIQNANKGVLHEIQLFDYI